MLLKVTAALSAVACAVAVVLWVRSYWVSDHVGLTRIEREFRPAEMRDSFPLPLYRHLLIARAALQVLE